MGNSQSVSSTDSEKCAQDCLARLRPKLEEHPTWCRLLQLFFLRRVLLEWGSPRAVLTDNGTKFGNVLLKELCRLWRVKLNYTPPLHPQSSYTERANRYVGETIIRNLVNAPGARRCD